MTRRAVVITETAMRDCLNSGKVLPVWTKERGQWIATWTVKHRSERPMLVHVYTSVDPLTGVSREIGEDSIRIALVTQTRTGRVVGLMRETYTTRTEGWTERLKAKLHDIFVATRSVPLCPLCSSLMAVRHGKHGEFWGCVEWRGPQHGCHGVFTRA